MELGIDGLHELLERGMIATAPRLEQLSDVDGAREDAMARGIIARC